MKRAAWFGWLLVGLMIVLTPMAWASPIDPSWTKGVYDDGDFDDVVSYLTSATTIVNSTFPINDLQPAPTFISADPVLDERFAAARSPASHSPRAPPVS